MTNHNDALIIAPFGAVSIAAYGSQLAVELLPTTSVTSHQPSANPLVNLAYTQILQYLQTPNMQFSLPTVAQGTTFSATRVASH